MVEWLEISHQWGGAAEVGKAETRVECCVKLNERNSVAIEKPCGMVLHKSQGIFR